MPHTALEAADQDGVLPHPPVRREIGSEARVEAEGVADEVGRLELDRVTDTVVARQTAAACIHFEFVCPVSLARAVVLEGGIEVRRIVHDDVDAGEQDVHALTVDVYIGILPSAVAQLAAAAYPDLVLEHQYLVAGDPAVALPRSLT